jgi:hypothetical protein
MYIGIHVKYCYYCENSTEIEFYWAYCLKILSFMKIRLVGAEMVYSDGWTGVETDRQTDTEEEANSLYSQLCKLT